MKAYMCIFTVIVWIGFAIAFTAILEMKAKLDFYGERINNLDNP